MTEYSKEMAKFIVNFVYEDIPKKVVEKTKMHFLDTIGVTIGAFDQPWSEMVTELVKQTQGSAQSKVIGLDGKYPSMMAALANGTMAHGIDMDDSGAEGWAHPGACLVPSGFAVGENEKISGKELITALLLGYEINGRVDGSLYPSLRDKGFHATAVVGTIGAAVTAGKILKLDEEQMVNALGLAGTQAAGLEEWLNTGDMSKRLHAGKAAMNGVISAQLAKKGYTGPSSVFEGKYGLASTHTEDYDLKILLDGLGEEFKIMDAKFKPFACCHELCGPIRLALKAQSEHDIKIEEIEKIRIGLNHVTAENQLKVAETPLHAQNHPAVAVSIALVEDQILMKEFFECYSDPKVRALGKKCEIYVDEEIEENFPSKTGTRLEIVTKDDKYSYFEDNKPIMPYSKLKEKFKGLASLQLSEDKVEKFLEMSVGLEDISDINKLSALLS